MAETAAAGVAVADIVGAVAFGSARAVVPAVLCAAAIAGSAAVVGTLEEGWSDDGGCDGGGCDVVPR